jgi:hypothetical protein
MPGITLAQAQAALDAALAAHAAILGGGTQYRIGERMIQCPPLTEVLQSISTWQAEVQRLSAGVTSRGPRIYGVTPG